MASARSTGVRNSLLSLLLLWIQASGLVTACTPHPIYRNTGAEVSPSSRSAGGGRIAKPGKTAHPVDLSQISRKNAYQVGVASYYGEKFHGRKTANGETFNMYKLTAAHRVLPLGTMIRVTHLTNGRRVVVKVNDRGPFIEGRVLDLSFAAALELEMVSAGTAEVMIEIIQEVD